MLAVGANGTAIMAALPSMRTELSLSSAGVQWAVNAYLVTSAACIVLGGRAADRFGVRPSSLVGLALFGVASCIIAMADSQAALLAGRTLQGFAAAFAVPCTLAAVNASAAPERKAAAIGAWTGFLMLGFSIGPLLGGALTHIAGWRAIFWLNALLMIVASRWHGLTGLGDAPCRHQEAPPRGLAGLPSDGDIHGGVGVRTARVVRRMVGAAARSRPVRVGRGRVILLLLVEARVETPLIDLSFFKRREFVMGLAIGSLSMFSIMSLLLYFNLYAQSPQGFGLNSA